MNEKSLWEIYGEKQLAEMEAVTNRYKGCIDIGKTERECVRLSIKMAEEAGYRHLKDFAAEGKTLHPGDKIYAVYNEKTLALYHIGEEPLEKGMNILGAHIDSPRIDIKQNPLYEKDGLAYLDTHYYGGIKKYQWVTIPLAIHGVIVRKDGTKAEVNIGEDDNDPVFTITDILVHLSKKQMEKKAGVVIEGENLDLLIGSVPLPDEEKDAVKANMLKLLEEKYQIKEDDFLSAELEIVPVGRARDLGFDRSMILAYGQDDRICAFTSLMAILEMEETPKRTSCCILVDKEEIGSYGASGMQSRFFENATAEVLQLCGCTTDISLRRCLQNSKMLSSDVSAAYDPLYADVFEKKNSAFFGKGLVFNKYTGSGGKGSSSDANAEYMAEIRKVMDDAGVMFQTAELGKVDAGGGGTIAWIMANYGMEVIDSGLAILCMHAPMEVSSKADIYEAVRGYQAFLQNMS
ncbi:aminopeptidase [Emergencia sp.]|uniref:aminopeptidase n=1 Tax=Emergencia sp. TaxID=1926557 RepID=UPI003AF1D99A